MSHAQSAPPRENLATGSRALEVALVVALWVEGVLAVLRLLGPFELGLGNERATAHIPLTLRLLANLELLIPTGLLGGFQAFWAMDVTSVDGTRVAAQAIPGDARAMLIASDLLRTAIVLSVTYLLLLMVRSLRAGDPFTESNSRRIVKVALLVVVGGEAAALLDTMAAHLVVSSGEWLVGWSRYPVVVDLHPLAYGIVLAIIAAVFRHGVALRREVDGLV